MEKGWDKLSIFTYKAAGDPFIQSYLAGYMQGRLEAAEINIYFNVKNEANSYNNNNEYKEIFEFFDNVNTNLNKKLLCIKSYNSKYNSKSKNIEESELMKYNNLPRFLIAYSQIKGLLNGYTIEAIKKNYAKLEMKHLLLMQADGELSELKRAITYLNKKKKTRIGDKNYFKEAFGINTSNPKMFWEELLKSSRCSALVKIITDKNSNIKNMILGHTTWGERMELIRSFKMYNLELEDNDDFPKTNLLFPAYPGTLSSTDDFYITNNELAITETTLEILDINAYSHIKPVNLYFPNYIRVLTASRFAKTGKEWIELFSSYNSGTYSSQWLILDYKVFKNILGLKNNEVSINNEKHAGLLYMLEQQPKDMIYHDVSKYLICHGYMASYNRIFFDENKRNLKMNLIRSVYGNFLGNNTESSRGKQFKMLQNNVIDITSMFQIMRYNGYKLNKSVDDDSNNDPKTAISALYELQGLTGKNNSFVGGIDTKVTDYLSVQDLQIYGINGPTGYKLNKNLPNYKINSKLAKSLNIKEDVDYPCLKINPENMINNSTNDIYNIYFPEEGNLNLKVEKIKNAQENNIAINYDYEE